MLDLLVLHSDLRAPESSMSPEEATLLLWMIWEGERRQGEKNGNINFYIQSVAIPHIMQLLQNPIVHLWDRVTIMYYERTFDIVNL